MGKTRGHAFEPVDSHCFISVDVGVLQVTHDALPTGRFHSEEECQGLCVQGAEPTVPDLEVEKDTGRMPVVCRSGSFPLCHLPPPLLFCSLLALPIFCGVLLG